MIWLTHFLLLFQASNINKIKINLGVNGEEVPVKKMRPIKKKKSNVLTPNNGNFLFHHYI